MFSCSLQPYPNVQLYQITQVWQANQLGEEEDPLLQKHDALVKSL